jgi:hypothetical protein
MNPEVRIPEETDSNHEPSIRKLAELKYRLHDYVLFGEPVPIVLVNRNPQSVYSGKIDDEIV